MSEQSNLELPRWSYVVMPHEWVIFTDGEKVWKASLRDYPQIADPVDTESKITA